jgi:hypothetical protein
MAYEITPDAGYRISDVLVDGTSIGSVANYAFISVVGNHTIEASFIVDEINVALSENTYDSGQYGYGFDANGPYTILSATFTSDGNDRILHVQSYDIDSSDEIGVYLNDNLLGYLSGADEDFGPESLWWLPVDQQIIGENTVEFRQKDAGETWGLQRLGIFSTDLILGDLETPEGNDRSHAEGFEVHFQGDSSRLLELAGWAHHSDEIEFFLNSQFLGVLPQGPDGDWSPAYHLLLPSAYLNPEDNFIEIRNIQTGTADWGAMLAGLRPSGIAVGNMPDVAGGAVEEAYFLVPVGAETEELGMQFYNVELEDGVQISVNGSASGYAPITDLDQWGDVYSLMLEADQLAVVEIRSEYDGLTWGVRLD